MAITNIYRYKERVDMDSEHRPYWTVVRAQNLDDAWDEHQRKLAAARGVRVTKIRKEDK